MVFNDNHTKKRPRNVGMGWVVDSLMRGWLIYGKRQHSGAFFYFRFDDFIFPSASNQNKYITGLGFNEFVINLM